MDLPLPSAGPGCYGKAIELRALVQSDAPGLTLLTAGRRPYGAPNTRVLGWRPDLPDHRDWGRPRLIAEVRAAAQQKGAQAAVAAANVLATAPELPSAMDLRCSGWLAPVEDQGEVGSCTAHAVIGLLEALNNRMARDSMDLSRLFLYKATRNLLGWSGDTGAHLRTTIKAARLFGVPPEEFWPYDPARFDAEPEAFHYAFASNYRALKFARLDCPDRDASQVLQNVKASLADGHTVAFGFSVFDNINKPAFVGEIPFPDDKAKLIGGHAVLAVGYDDDAQTTAPSPGALIVQNSWGADWGDRGYGYLPYEYLHKYLAEDFWTVIHSDWVSKVAFE